MGDLSFVLAVAAGGHAFFSGGPCEAAGRDALVRAVSETSAPPIAETRNSEPDTAPRSEMRCYALARDLTRGDVITARDLETGPCPPSSGRQPLRYDSVSAVLTASEDIPRGARVGPLVIDGLSAHAKGATAAAGFHHGAVTVERSVELLQPAPAQGRVMVRTADGDTFSVEVGALALRERAE